VVRVARALVVPGTPGDRRGLPRRARRRRRRRRDDREDARRDRALLTLGWSSACRRSELVALDVVDVELQTEGLLVHVRRSKGDQEGKSFDKGVPYASAPALCAVRALRAWLDAAGITEGPIFRGVDRYGHVSKTRLSDRSVARVVQRAASAAGLDPSRYGKEPFPSGKLPALLQMLTAANE
jgi:integrase